MYKYVLLKLVDSLVSSELASRCSIEPLAGLPLSEAVRSRTNIENTEYSYKINFCDTSIVPAKLDVAQLLLVNVQVF